MENNQQAIAQALQARTLEDLVILCYDEFPAIYAQLGPNTPPERLAGLMLAQIPPPQLAERLGLALVAPPKQGAVTMGDKNESHINIGSMGDIKNSQLGTFVNTNLGNKAPWAIVLALFSCMIAFVTCISAWLVVPVGDWLRWLAEMVP
ncbi:hypothetical protein QUF63_02145 [Anaerolineales bacterium HSG25]|nr:hypothetical protein [Anaerolineales bacterium HSG25]